MRRTKIICTIGPASAGRDVLHRLVAAGMDVVRLNFSHGTHAEHAEVIRAIRDGEAEWGRPVTIVQDLQGPKVRLGQFAGGRAWLRPVRALRSRPSLRSALPCMSPIRSFSPRSGPGTRCGWMTA